MLASLPLGVSREWKHHLILSDLKLQWFLTLEPGDALSLQEKKIPFLGHSHYS